MTARLDLGASPAQLIRVRGLEKREFAEYVAMMAAHLGLPWTLGSGSKLMKKFHDTIDGSPIFATSILRLVHMGEHLDVALNKWKGADGEEVRKFAFKKELDGLSESRLRTLYAACLLGDTSLVELKQILKSSEGLVRDDVGELRKYHLLALGADIPEGGTRLLAPSGIQLMSSLIA